MGPLAPRHGYQVVGEHSECTALRKGRQVGRHALQARKSNESISLDWGGAPLKSAYPLTQTSSKHVRSSVQTSLRKDLNCSLSLSLSRLASADDKLSTLDGDSTISLFPLGFICACSLTSSADQETISAMITCLHCTGQSLSSKGWMKADTSRSTPHI